jgi:hypothetical protein
MAAIAQRLARLARAVAALPPCPVCAGGPALVMVGRGEVPPTERCPACGRELEAICFADPYSSIEEDPT